MFARQRKKHKAGRQTAALVLSTVAISLFAYQGGWQSASAQEFDPYKDAPAGKASLPLAPDVILNYANGKAVASAYKFSYICPTNPEDDLNVPYNVGIPGVDEHRDFLEYQSQPCYFGTTEKSKVLELPEITSAFGGVRELYGLAPWFQQVPTVAGQLTDLYGANTPISDIQANCPRQGLPVTSILDPVGSCLMHMNVLHFPEDQGGGDIKYKVPAQAPLPAHSHILGGLVSPDGKVSTKESPTSLGPTWWHPRAVQVLDRSIWPDAAGNCPAGREHCLTSIKALREAQAKGQARPEGGSNILLYFSVQEIDQAGLNTLDSISPNDVDGSFRPDNYARWQTAVKDNYSRAEAEAAVKAIGKQAFGKQAAGKQAEAAQQKSLAPADVAKAGQAADSNKKATVVRNEAAAVRKE